jgi:hypothetical protein
VPSAAVAAPAQAAQRNSTQKGTVAPLTWRCRWAESRRDRPESLLYFDWKRDHIAKKLHAWRASHP